MEVKKDMVKKLIINKCTVIFDYYSCNFVFVSLFFLNTAVHVQIDARFMKIISSYKTFLKK
jgi:hypothetical protein